MYMSPVAHKVAQCAIGTVLHYDVCRYCTYVYIYIFVYVYTYIYICICHQSRTKLRSVPSGQYCIMMSADVVHMYTCIYLYTYIYICICHQSRTKLRSVPSGQYGVATVSRIDKTIGLFCRILALLKGSFAQETYNFIDPTNQSHPILHYDVCRYYTYVYMHIFIYI